VARSEARPMRSKEEAHDYRYFPEPDLPPLVLDDALIEKIRAELPELPEARATRFADAYALRASDVEVLIADREVADFYEAVARESGDPKGAANWIMTYAMSAMNTRSVTIGELGVSSGALAELIKMVNQGGVSITSARRVFSEMLDTGKSPQDLVKELGLTQVSDDDQIAQWAADIVAAHPDVVAKYRAGDAKVFGFLMGELMKKSKGKAEAKRANEALRSALS
jgi:aspartyl-tRNA(Asn)/glutamyl-tRNA(Gln) amidotransferase subunit B